VGLELDMESVADIELELELEQPAVEMVLELVLVPQEALLASRALSLLLQKHPDFLHPVRPAAVQTFP